MPEHKIDNSIAAGSGSRTLCVFWRSLSEAALA